MDDHRFWFEKEQSKFAEAELKVSLFGGNISFFLVFWDNNSKSSSFIILKK